MHDSRNILPQIAILGKKFHVTGRNFLSPEEISCPKKKFPVTGRHFLSRKNFHRKRQNFKPQKEICFYKKKFPGTRQNFLLQKVIFCQRKKWLGLGKVIVMIYTPHYVKSLFVIVVWLYSLSFKHITQNSYILGMTPPPFHKCAYVILEPNLSKITHN